MPSPPQGVPLTAAAVGRTDSYHRVRPSPWPSEPVCRRGRAPTSALWGSVTGSSPLPPPPEAANETARVSADPPNSALLLLVHLSHLQIGPGLEEIPESSKPARKVRSNNGGMGAGTLRLNPPAACFPVFLSQTCYPGNNLPKTRIPGGQGHPKESPTYLEGQDDSD